MKVNEIGTCPICKKKYVATNTRQIYCSKSCCLINQGKKRPEENVKKTKDKKPKAKSLVEIMKEAEAIGMTYGEYVAVTEYGKVVEHE